MSCIEIGIPEHLITNGRLVMNVFEGEELFRRIEIIQTLSDGKLSVESFMLQSDSVNRSKFSQPVDVLYNIKASTTSDHYFHWGILGCKVDSLFSWTFIIDNTERFFTINIRHMPEECMYPHCEILILEDGNEVNVSKPKSVKNAIRHFYRGIWEKLKSNDSVV